MNRGSLFPSLVPPNRKGGQATVRPPKGPISSLVEPSDFMAITTEDFLSHAPIDRFPELEPWKLYMTSRYSFLK
jgi:hypothetical protein